MSVRDKLKNASARLGPNKARRAFRALKNYGLREFMRRGVAKLRGETGALSDAGRRLIVTNESYYPPGNPRGLEPRTDVSFVTAPSADSITQLEIRTCSGERSADARLHLEVRNGDAVVASASTGVIADGGDTVLRFPAVRGVFGQPLRFTLHAQGEGTGILVHPQKTRDGFTVDGGGSVACRVLGLDGEDPYQEWLTWNAPTAEELRRQEEERPHGSFACGILIGSEADMGSARRLIGSIVDQTYAGWHVYLLCPKNLRQTCDELAQGRSKEISTVVLADAEDPVTALLAAGEDEFIAFMDPSCILARQALYACSRALEEGADLVYGDEDTLSEDGMQRGEPFFKPDYSPNYLLSFNYIGGFVAMKRTVARAVSARSMYDAVLQATDAAREIRHIPDILVSMQSGSRPQKLTEEDRSAVERALSRRGISGQVHPHSSGAFFEIDYDIPEQAPRVVILIPNYNAPDMIRECVSSILEKTTYPSYEIVIIENNSTDPAVFSYYEEIQKNPRVRVLTWNHPFNFAAINNWAVRQTEGDLLLFLNNDTTVIAPDWLTRMAALCARPDVGAVGAKLLYPDNTVQHGGVIMRMMGIAGHAHLGAPAESTGSFYRLCVPFDVSGATGACLMIPRDVFEKVGGFDEQYVLAFNDVDICLKIRELGLTILFEPRASLYHYESKTRGYEITPEQQKRFRNEQIIWIRKWLDRYPGDPFYNPNLRYDTCAFDTAPEKCASSMHRVAKPYDDLIDAELDLT